MSYRVSCAVCDFTEVYDSVDAADAAGLDHLSAVHWFFVDEEEE